MASPLDSARVRLVADLAYDDRPGQVEELWFDVAGEHAPSLSRTGNPWLVVLAPLAAKIGQPIRLSLPVDRVLLRNVRELIAVWRSWRPRLREVEIEAEVVDASFPAVAARTAAAFSGGVDSFFTILRAREPGAIELDDLITIAGFDIALENFPAFERRRARQAVVAEALGSRLVDVLTNLRYTRIESANWSEMVHGPALAGVALALEGTYQRFLLGSTADYRNLVPHGSHPLTDPLLSTSRLTVLHDGAGHNRTAKIEYVSRSDVALRHLHVCFRMASDLNCGKCEKCLRTMAVLELLGRLERADSFPERRLDVARLARVHVRSPLMKTYYESIIALAVERDRGDIARAAGHALRRSRWRRGLMTVPKWCADRRGFWRAASPIRRVLLAGRVV